MVAEFGAGHFVVQFIQEELLAAGKFLFERCVLRLVLLLETGKVGDGQEIYISLCV